MAKYRFMVVVEGPCIDCGDPTKAEWIQVDAKRPVNLITRLRHHRCGECLHTYAAMYPVASEAMSRRMHEAEATAIANMQEISEVQAPG